MPGFHKFFMTLWQDGVNMARDIMSYINKRGGWIELQELPKPAMRERMHQGLEEDHVGLVAMETALAMERDSSGLVSEIIERVERIQRSPDPHLVHTLEDNHLAYKVKVIKQIADYVTKLRSFQTTGEDYSLVPLYATPPPQGAARPIIAPPIGLPMPPPPPLPPPPPSQELLWTGTHRGHVASYYGMDCHKYTAFQVSPAEDAQPEIRQIMTFDSGVLALTSTRLRCTQRRGLPVYTFSDSDMQHMQCMIQFGSDTILMGGHQSKVIEFNARKGQIVNKYEVGEAGCAVFRQGGKYLCAGDATGKVTLYDPSTMRKEHVLDAHSSMLSDFDVQGHLLVTCGLSKRMNNLVADRLLMVYDMRVMRAMAPIQSSIDPTFLRFLPHIPNHLIIVSQMGSFQLTDTTSNAPSMLIVPVTTQGAGISSFDLSPTCQGLAFGDTAGQMHLFANNEHAIFSTFQEPTEFAVPFEPPLNGIHIMDELASFATVPMLYPANEDLLSEWPSSMSRKVYRKPKPIDPDILRSMKVVHNVYCVPNPGKTRRNQVPYKLVKDDGTKRQLSVPESPSGRGEDPFKTVPKTYQRMLMRYTKLDDFDFCHYNKTKFAGLIAEYANSYCNAMLQVLYFVEPLRAALLSHICQREFCLACELGFLFHMLDTKMGEACQAKNFLRAFRTIPEASALSLVLTEAEEGEWSGQAGTTYAQLAPLHAPSDSLAHQIKTRRHQAAATDAAAEKKQDSAGKSKKKKNKAARQSGAKGRKKDEKSDAGEAGEDKSTEDERLEETSVALDLFAIQLKSSLQCSRCSLETWRDGQTMLFTLNYPHIPPLVSSVECFRESAGDAGDAYSTGQFGPSWIPLGLRIKLLEDGDLSVAEISDEEPLPKDETERREFYEIYGVVYCIQQQDAGRHLVSCVKVSEPYHQRKERVTCHQWYLFNDFCIQPIEKPENIAVDLTWKVPFRSWCSPDILYNDPALANPKRRKITFLPLQLDETLNKGDLVGLDAEFISLKDVTDYLTEFSGIEPSELDPTTSTKHLTTLKSSYQKLRCLLDIGVVFVGHGLKKDFKVPKDQIIDTVYLFNLPRQRFVSLRFLAWFFLNCWIKYEMHYAICITNFIVWLLLTDKNIQSGGHDSAEDARTALQLYLRYRELSAEGPDKAKTAIKELPVYQKRCR
nr:hypothetical protein BaRGS_006215 [Batillaria attramentaria]